MVETLATNSIATVAPGYVRVSLNMSAFIVQSMKIRFFGAEDGSLATSFLIDDVMIVVQ